MFPISLPVDMPTDGCTLPLRNKPVIGKIVRVLGMLLLFMAYEDYCREHDFLRRYNIVHWFRANLLFARRILNHNPILGVIHAPIFLLATTISYPFYKDTIPLPSRWIHFGVYYRTQVNGYR